MDPSSDESKQSALDEAQQVQRWVRRYAQNRSLGVAVNLILYAILYVAIGLASYWGGIAYRCGDTGQLTICLAVLTAAVGTTIYFSVPWWGGRRLQRTVDWLYAGEGRVTIATANGKRAWLKRALAGGFAVCVLASVTLGLLGYLPDGKYMQPISAIYCVPFLIGMTFSLRSAIGYVPLLWPLLYAVHAALIVAGAPIVFVGAWEPLNMLVPLAGYGLLTSLVGHFYSRWALHNLRSLALRQHPGPSRPPQSDSD